MLIKFAIQEFIGDREFKNLSPVTIKTYQVTLKEFQEYCTQHEILDVDDISTLTIKGYIMYCQKERHNNPTTRNSKLHHIKIFFMNFRDAKQSSHIFRHTFAHHF